MGKLTRIFLFSFIALVILACQTLYSAHQVSIPTQTTLTGKDLYLKIRIDTLETKAETLGLLVDPNSSIPYGVVMDTMLDSESVSTLISFASGDAGLVATSGHGRTDGIKFQNVQIAAKKFVSVAAGFVDKMELVTDYPLPTTVGNIKFYIITPRGIYTTNELTEHDVMAGSFYKLWKAGADVIAAFRLSDSQPTP